MCACVDVRLRDNGEYMEREWERMQKWGKILSDRRISTTFYCKCIDTHTHTSVIHCVWCYSVAKQNIKYGWLAFDMWSQVRQKLLKPNQTESNRTKPMPNNNVSLIFSFIRLNRKTNMPSYTKRKTTTKAQMHQVDSAHNESMKNKEKYIEGKNEQK